MTADTAPARAASAPIALVRPGAPCNVCSGGIERRQAVESALATTASLRAIAGQFGIPRESLRRHLRLHLGPSVREHLERAGRLSALNIAARLAEVADAAKDIRESAEERISELDAAPRTARSAQEQRIEARLALRAGDSETDTLGRIAERMGVTDGKVIEQFGEAVAIIGALGRIVREHPEMAPVLAAALANEGATGLAYTVRRAAEEAAA